MLPAEITTMSGSDFDIDKVSLLGFKFRGGHFIKWSDLMDLTSENLLNASENIPFPSGYGVHQGAAVCTGVADGLYGRLPHTGFPYPYTAPET